MAESNAAALSEQQRYDEGYGLHPDDVLIMKWFPDCTPLELDRTSGRGNRYWKLHFIRDMEDPPNGDGMESPCKTWPTPPLRPRSQLEPGVEEWRQLRLQMIEAHIARWTRGCNTHLNPTSTRSVATIYKEHHQPKPRSSPACHRALGIAELLETILRHLDRASTYTAWDVCSSWRATLSFLLKSHFRNDWPCVPIEYNQTISADILSLRPSLDEIERFEQELLQEVANPQGYGGLLYRPARFHQALSFPDSALVPLAAVYELYSYVTSQDGSALPPRWLDLSQVEFNPYFTDLYTGQIQPKFGLRQLTLLPGQQQVTTDRTVYSSAFHQVIGTMFATQPPCKAFTFYVQHPRDGHWITRVGNVRNSTGVRICELVAGLEVASTEVMQLWSESVRKGQKAIGEKFWTKYTLDRDRNNVWQPMECGPVPKIIIMLDSLNGEEANISKRLFSIAGWTPEQDKVEWEEAFVEWQKEGSTA